MKQPFSNAYRSALRVALVAAALLSTAGCVTGNEPESSVDRGSTDASTGDTGVTGDGTTSDAPTPVSPEADRLEPHPLDRYSYLFGSDWDEAEHRAIQEATEALTAQCMADEGFDYVPLPAFTPPMTFASERHDDIAYAARYGYGITTYREEAEAEGTDYWNSPPPENPNADYVASLTPAEREEYDRTLSGYWATPTPGPGESYGDYTEGCREKAQKQVDPRVNAPNPLADERYAELRDAIHFLHEKVDADSRVADLYTEWSACLASAGYDFATSEDAYSSISDQATAIRQERDPGPSAPPLASHEFGDLVDQELALATADATCMREVRWDERYRALEIEYENDLIATYQATFDELEAEYAPEQPE